MIRLELKDYCHDCCGFEAKTIYPDKVYAVGEPDVPYMLIGDTVVTCEHRERCASAVKYVMEGYKENADR